MSTSIKIDLDSISDILAKRKLDGEAQLKMSSEIHKLSMPYIPFDNNPLSTNVDIEEKSITYISPYAKYQWYGKAMAGNPRKPTSKDLSYQGAPKRGKEWTNRAMADHKEELTEEVAKFIGGKVE